MTDEKEKQAFEDAVLYGEVAGRARIPGDVFTVGPVVDEETIKAMRAARSPAAFIDAAFGLASLATLAESMAAGINAALAQLQGDVHAQVSAGINAALTDLRAQYPQPPFGSIVADFIRHAQEQAGALNHVPPIAALVLDQQMNGAAMFAAQNQLFRKDEGCQREAVAGKVQELDTVA